MNKSNIISEVLRGLEIQTTLLFNELTKDGQTYDFLNNKKSNGIDEDAFQKELAELKETNEFGSLPLVAITNKFTGDVSDVHILSVSEQGINTINSMDDSEQTIRFIDLAGIDHQLVLLNEMENLL